MWVNSVAVSADGRLALSGSADRTVKVWDLTSGQELRTLAGHADGVNSVAVSADGRLALSGSDDRTVKVWDLETGNCLATLPLERPSMEPGARSGRRDGGRRGCNRGSHLPAAGASVKRISHGCRKPRRFPHTFRQSGGRLKVGDSAGARGQAFFIPGSRGSP